MTSAEHFTFLQDLVWVALLAGVAGGLLVLLVASLLRLFLEWNDRALDRAESKLFPPLDQSGRAGLGVLLWLVAVAAFLVACSAAPAHYSDDHAVWVEKVKRAGW